MATIAIEAMTAAMTSGRDDCGLRDIKVGVKRGADKVAGSWRCDALGGRGDATVKEYAP
jgi:hypothetical protein